MSNESDESFADKFFYRAFLIGLLFISFFLGVYVATFRVFPYNQARNAWRTAKVLFGIPHYLTPTTYEGEGVVIDKRDEVYPGATLITGIWKKDGDFSIGARLIDLDGNILNEWVLNTDDLSAEAKRKAYIHGSILLPNGDLVFNHEHDSLYRMNKDSEVIWKLPMKTHHSVFQDKSGNFWVPGGKMHEDSKEFPLGPPFVEDTVLKVSPNGEVLEEISLLKSIYDSGYEGIIKKKTGDVLHLNNVDVLGENMADAFDVFEAGDIMVSMRHIHTIMVLDGKTHLIKWLLTLPIIGQHDPDFHADGTITIYDNHSIGIDPGAKNIGSRILQVDPQTNEVKVLYGHKEKEYFYALRGGKHQKLSNGNILITEPGAGRVFEINPKNEVVWSWINSKWDDEYTSEILEGTRYDEETIKFIEK